MHEQMETLFLRPRRCVCVATICLSVIAFYLHLFVSILMAASASASTSALASRQSLNVVPNLRINRGTRAGEGTSVQLSLLRAGGVYVCTHDLYMP